MKKQPNNQPHNPGEKPMPLEQQLTQLQQCAHTHNDHKTASILQEAINNIHKLPNTQPTENDKRRAIEKTIQPRKDLQEAALRGGNKDFSTLIDKEIKILESVLPPLKTPQQTRQLIHHIIKTQRIDTTPKTALGQIMKNLVGRADIDNTVAHQIAPSILKGNS